MYGDGPDRLNIPPRIDDDGAALKGLVIMALAIAAIMGLGLFFSGNDATLPQVTENIRVQTPAPPMTSPAQIPEHYPP